MATQTGDIERRFIDRMIEITKDSNTKGVIAIMLKQGVISEDRIRNYMICHDYTIYLTKNSGKISETVYDLSALYDLQPRRIERIIQYWRLKLAREGNAFAKLF